MTLSDLHRSQLQRERDRAAKDQQTIASISSKLARKQSALAQARTALRQKSLQREIDRLREQRAKAERSVGAHQKKIADLEAKLAKEDRDRQAKAARAERATATTLGRLQERVDDLEEHLLAGVRDAVAADPVTRAYDVFLSHAGPDKETAEALYVELTRCGLDVWFDGAEIRLGESLTAQIDRGIRASRVGIVLLTPTFLAGRYWTEAEKGALLSTHRRVIPILDGVSREDLAGYSPLLTDLVGLETAVHGFEEMAERIKQTLQDVGPSQKPA